MFCPACLSVFSLRVIRVCVCDAVVVQMSRRSISLASSRHVCREEVALFHLPLRLSVFCLTVCATMCHTCCCSGSDGSPHVYSREVVRLHVVSAPATLVEVMSCQCRTKGIEEKERGMNNGLEDRQQKRKEQNHITLPPLGWILFSFNSNLPTPNLAVASELSQVCAFVSSSAKMTDSFMVTASLHGRYL
ncbi:hypothetical protein B0H63DRAFT_283675 [Podospora didyma]|uniref:Uncharacterized protein n=1 Tax=Podospora didyma TaxID=330526 RepID=A0AAE0K8A1_9PEZI|nr:hypothetical protein B0H63DRAFT_283675 [Podospora didyma]